MKVKEASRWECSCGELHETEQEAIDCCPVEEIEGFECGECNEFYEDRDEAKECCKE